MCVIWPLMMFIVGCKTLTVTNATACEVGFDYKDPNVNEQNARALLTHYCICKDEKLCQ